MHVEVSSLCVTNLPPCLVTVQRCHSARTKSVKQIRAACFKHYNDHYAKHLSICQLDEANEDDYNVLLRYLRESPSLHSQGTGFVAQKITDLSGKEENIIQLIVNKLKLRWRWRYVKPVSYYSGKVELPVNIVIQVRSAKAMPT